MNGENVTQIDQGSRQVAGGNGNGNNLHGRVSALEAHLQHLATKNDLSALREDLAKAETTQTRWLVGVALTAVGVLLTAVVGLGIAVVRTFQMVPPG